MSSSHTSLADQLLAAYTQEGVEGMQELWKQCSPVEQVPFSMTRMNGLAMMFTQMEHRDAATFCFRTMDQKRQYDFLSWCAQNAKTYRSAETLFETLATPQWLVRHDNSLLLHLVGSSNHRLFERTLQTILQQQLPLDDNMLFHRIAQHANHGAMTTWLERDTSITQERVLEMVQKAVQHGYGSLLKHLCDTRPESAQWNAEITREVCQAWAQGKLDVVQEVVHILPERLDWDNLHSFMDAQRRRQQEWSMRPELQLLYDSIEAGYLKNQLRQELTTLMDNNSVVRPKHKM